MDTLYPPIEPYDHGWLTVGDGHEVYYEQCGNPVGKPCLFVHGGPGGGAGKDARRFFDPERYRIVLFDQRGCGRSRPHASLEANTTWDLVADMERLRETLRIERWLVFGGSWGSTLSLAYAQAHPEVVSELVLRGIFLLREREIRWFYQHGASELYPDAWEAYLAPIPEDERDDLVQAFHRRLTGPDEDERLAAARAWSVWEASTSFLRPRAAFVAELGTPAAALAMARIECHYFVNGGFLEHPDQLLEGIDRIRHIPAVIVQGRYDVVCPPVTAWSLHRAWPEAEFHLVADAGHSAFDGGNAAALVAATDRLARECPELNAGR
ncbi:prolyl aminopeptidase [Pseudohaliea rubra]|uniref:Proline iminopeptidase n=1 Tax=Pseudohaliea rubra DSM 19751 TaxID=1265313 RepID=A0A095VUP8_9GAMM|nr:prolyl aminopeptidase [Pseudohaliea rubra]KGE05070.1 Proline iminopeptidase [Pseudohaliea rubra DSM 19751]